jgi:hypothetical protein
LALNLNKLKEERKTKMLGNWFKTTLLMAAIVVLFGFVGAAIGGVIIGFFSYAALCYATGLAVVALGVWSLKLRTK